MEYLRNEPETTIQLILRPTIEAFIPRLEANREHITSIPKKTFVYRKTQFGIVDRHKIDVFYPKFSAVPGKKPPMLLFIYGGGFAVGERSFPAPADLGYGNIASFFAHRGILTCIADYRLVPFTSYPGPMEDMRDALAWMTENIPEGDTSNMFVMGHSAGANIAISMLLHPTIGPSTPDLKGLIINGAPYNFVGPVPRLNPDVSGLYYGDAAAKAAHGPDGLLRSACSEVVETLPPILMLTAEKDPPNLKDTHAPFFNQLRERGVKSLQEDVLWEHNHISMHWALGTGDADGEAWGEKLAVWIKYRALYGGCNESS